MHPLTLALACAVAALAAALAFWRAPRMPRAWALLAVALVPIVASLFGLRWPGMFLLSVAAIVAWGVRNRDIAGAPLIAAGACLNVLAMALHGGAMPIDTGVLARLGEVAAPGTVLDGSKDIAVASSPIWLLSDWIALAARGYTVVVSPGDVVVFAGIMWWLLASRRSGKDHEHARHGTRMAKAFALWAK
jgi:hypothetical protein